MARAFLNHAAQARAIGFACVAVVCLVAGVVLAQSVPPAAGPARTLNAGDQAPAQVDTAVAVLEFSPPEASPNAVHVVQDSVLFGATLHVVVDHAEVAPTFTVVDGAAWLVPIPPEDPGWWKRLLGRGGAAPVDLTDLPPPEELRTVHSFRIYRNQPFRVRIADHLSSVIQVRNRIAGTEETAAIRAPRPVGMSPLVVLGLLAALVLLLLVAWVFWARGPGREPLANTEIPAPAWLAAAVELRGLFWEGALARGETRAYLDGLAGIARRFVAGRYRISAQDMTGREIIKACARLGHQVTDPGALGRLIDDMDHHRYDPAASTPAWCREQTVDLFEIVGRIRVMPTYTEVAPDIVLEAEKAWSELAREFAGATGRGRAREQVTGERGR